jgi:hypothetical protein
MKKNNLTSNKGLSLSQAQSISNLCNQRASEISSKLSNVNNYSKTVKVNGETHVVVTAKPLPTNVVELLKEKASLHACQAFLMENMKAKEAMLNEAKTEQADHSAIITPKTPVKNSPVILPVVTETWGWEQLTTDDLNKFMEAEAFAAHIGQFIHQEKSGVNLTSLRRELPEIPAIEWMVIEDGKKSPVTISKHHTSDELLKIHEELAELHRGYEQTVNYFKAKVKNLTTEENARIANVNADAMNAAAKSNADLQGAYETAVAKFQDEIKTIRAEFEKTRQAKIRTIAGMRIEIDTRFQGTIDKFLKQLPETKE